MKDHKDTICYRVERCIDLLEQAVKTDNLDVATFTKHLAMVRKQAQMMENGLRDRKEIMIANNLEDQYQTQKGEKKANTYIRNEAHVGKQEFEITLKQNGVEQFTRKAYAFVMSIVERVDELDEVGNITGESDTFMAGHPLAVFYGFDQLRQKMDEKQLEFSSAIRDAALSSKFLKPEYKKQLQEMTNLDDSPRT